jgi:CO dehydrogenase maturation factor
MIIGFLGKGGSGKSTLSTKFAKYLHRKGMEVLAIDADHNMDLSFNLEGSEDLNYIGTESIYGVINHLGIKKEEIINVLNDTTFFPFSFTNKDQYSDKYIHEIEDRMNLMCAGPQTERVQKGLSCSHSLASALKLYLPLLNLENNEFVVVDEKASVDAMTTGIPRAFNLVVIVAENTPHSKKAALQIKNECGDVPHVCVGNKIKSQDDVEQLKRDLGILCHLPYDNTTEEENKFFSQIFDHLNTISESRYTRRQRAIRFQNQKLLEGSE